MLEALHLQIQDGVFPDIVRTQAKDMSVLAGRGRAGRLRINYTLGMAVEAIRLLHPVIQERTNAYA